MRRAFWSAILAVLVSLLGAGSAGAAPADSSGTEYALITPPSALEFGCFGPCECPIQLLPTFGSFQLVPIGVDPLFTNYAVKRYIASFNNGPGAVAITGSGRYRIGGEFALVQQLTLDLDIEGQPTQHFDSGMVPVGTPFPQIDVSCSVHGFACLDSVLVVRARPIETTDVPISPKGVALTGVKPNPFQGSVVIGWTLPRAGSFDLSIVDLEGRRVRQLAHSGSGNTGVQSAVWDGRRDDGRTAPAGVYWISLRTPDGLDRRRIVKIE
jgi:hypothetical protein